MNGEPNNQLPESQSPDQYTTSFGQNEEHFGSRIIEGFLEKRRGDGEWTRQWAVIRENRVYFYSTPSVKIASDVIDLPDCVLSEQIDKYQGKRFVLQMETKVPNTNVLMSMDSRDELQAWQDSIQEVLKGLRVESGSRQESPRTVNGDKKGDTSSVKQETSEESSPVSTLTVKQKLLAEMLRQKMELQKVQAARNGMRNTWSGTESDNVPSSPGSSSSSTSMSPTVSSPDDRICTLTRLRQRRMSTQIKLHAIQKQMGESSGNSKEKKTWTRGRKRPDLVQTPSPTGGNTELQEHVKTLSSQLQELDTVITSHTIVSPRDSSVERGKKGLRHSYDSALIKHLSASGVGNRAKSDDVIDQGDVSPKDKDSEKESKSGGLKSSVQRFAHRTFARANWNRVKKSINTTENTDNSRLEVPPDVIDVTNNNDHKRISMDDSDIRAPPASFRSDVEYNFMLTSMTSDKKKHRSPRDKIWSKLDSSHSFTQMDKFSGIKPSISSPSLFKVESKFTGLQKNDWLSSLTSSNTNLVPRLRLNGDADDYASAASSPNSAGSTSREMSESGFFSARTVGEMPPHSARTPRSARSEGSRSSRKQREVNPNALAEIQAFEELSSKFLGS